MAREIKINNPQDYNKYFKKIQDNGWGDEDFQKALDGCDEKLISKITNRSTIISILVQNGVLTTDDRDEIEMEKTTEKTRNTVLLQRIKKCDILPCLPLLLATMDNKTMPHLSKLILSELDTNSKNSKGNEAGPNTMKDVSTKKSIEKNLGYLTENLSNVTKLCIILIEVGLLSMDEKERITKTQNDLDQSDKFFTTLLKKDLDKDNRWGILISAFKDSGNKDLADRLM